MMNSRRSLLLLLGLFGANKCSGFQTKLPANQDWECQECGDESQKANIFGMVRHAMYTESREVYLNFDHSWIDNALKPRQPVTVRSIKRENLADYKMPERIDPPGRDRDERYHVVISLPPENSENRPLTFSEAKPIENFLKLNPCWIPLHDPPVDIMKTFTPSNILDQSGTVVRSNPYEYSAIFIRMPAFPFHSTCLLYTEIAKRQYPATCPDKDSDKVHVSHLGEKIKLLNADEMR